MSVPSAFSPSDCCNVCPDIPITQVNGPQGPAGTNGTNGTNGADAFTTTTAGFVMPAIAATVVVAVANTAWMSVGQVVFVKNAGYFTVNAIGSAVSVTLANLGYVGNAAPTAVIGGGQTVSAGGLKGVDGVAVGVTMNSISPTTTRGDLIADNGANSPAASDVRLGVGTDGQQLTALAAQPTGLIYRTITPNAATDNVVPRFDSSGTTTPTPLQSSGIQITDTTAIQTTAGNARGTSAVDLQPVRAVVTQVASGNNSTIAGGQNNTASGANSVATGGNTNIASASGASVSGGLTNTASGIRSSVGGGGTNVASAQDATIAGGSANTASGIASTIPGGSNNIASAQDSSCLGGFDNRATGVESATVGGTTARSTKFGQVSHSNGSFAAAGDSQFSELLFRIGTTDATVGVEMFLDGAAERASIAVGSSWAFQILLIARSSAGVSAAWKAEGCILNTAGATALVAGPVVPVVIADGTGGTWGLAANFIVTADNGNDSLKLAVTGAVATLIRWSAVVRLSEVSYP